MEFFEFKFPRTPHLTAVGNTDEDIIFTNSECKSFFKDPVIIQEKIDGSNVVIFSDRDGPNYKHRGGKIIFPDNEYKNLDSWYNLHSEEISKICENRFIICGEWMFWRHSIAYRILPSFMIIHDIFDMRGEKFLSQKRVSRMLEDTAIFQMPVLFEGQVDDLSDIEGFMNKSLFGTEMKEGLYFRVDSKEYCEKRAKLVAPEFSRNITEHWRIGIPNKSLDNIEKYWQ
jgi:ATP-dependent RNA circularization protein (DNA/RNA ligase family)